MNTLNRAEWLSKLSKNVNASMALLMLLISVANILWAERLTVGGGLGWDGVIYAGWVKDFYQTVIVHGVPDYYAQRILPSAVVHYAMRLLRVPLEDQNIILTFDIYNSLLLVASAYLWGLIADELSISGRGKWFGFCFIFLSHAILKNNFYSPVQTDMSAFTLGLLMFYFFLIESVAGLLAVILFGGFVWPTLPHMAALLCALPRRREASDAGETSPRSRLAERAGLLAAAAISLATLAALLYLTASHLQERIDYFPRILRVDRQLLYPSIVAVAVYLFFSLRAALSDRELFDPRRVLAAISWKRAGLALLFLLILKALRHAVWSGEVMQWGNTKGFIMYTLLSALTEPFIFYVSHVVYFGPVVLLFLFFWRPFCESLREFGLGLRLLVVLNILLSINPQSRYEINTVTIFIIVLVKLLDGSFLRRQSLLLWVLLSLFYSKVWYVMNTGPQVDDGTMEVLLRFPLQHVFMNVGPWMSKQMYLVQGGVVLLTAGLLYLLVRTGRGKEQAESPLMRPGLTASDGA